MCEVKQESRKTLPNLKTDNPMTAATEARIGSWVQVKWMTIENLRKTMTGSVDKDFGC